MSAAVFVHAAGDDFDGCSSCWDDQHAEGIANPEPCQFPSPTIIGRPLDGLLNGSLETAPCEHCNHPVAVAHPAETWRHTSERTVEYQFGGPDPEQWVTIECSAADGDTGCGCDDPTPDPVAIARTVTA